MVNRFTTWFPDDRERFPKEDSALRTRMADVAKAAGVSVATVSYVLGGRNGDVGASRISEATQGRVHQAVANTGYRLHEPARTLRRQRTDRVLLLIDRLSSPHDQRLAATLERDLESTGRTLSIMVGASTDRLAIALTSLTAAHADGAVLILDESPVQQRMIADSAHAGIPIVAVSSRLEPDGFDVFANNEAPALGEAVDLLVSSGHRRIAYLSHTPASREFRLAVVQQHLARYGLSIERNLIAPVARDRVRAANAVRDMLARPDRPTAIISGSDSGAISALWGALAVGLRVPEDLAVIGCGNVEEGTITVPALTSVGPVQADDTLVSRHLIERLEHWGPMPGRLIERPWVFQRRGSV